MKTLLLGSGNDTTLCMGGDNNSLTGSIQKGGELHERHSRMFKMAQNRRRSYRRMNVVGECVRDMKVALNNPVLSYGGSQCIDNIERVPCARTQWGNRLCWAELWRGYSVSWGEVYLVNKLFEGIRPNDELTENNLLCNKILNKYCGIIKFTQVKDELKPAINHDRFDVSFINWNKIFHLDLS